MLNGLLILNSTTNFKFSTSGVEKFFSCLTNLKEPYIESENNCFLKFIPNNVTKLTTITNEKISLEHIGRLISLKKLHIKGVTGKTHMKFIDELVNLEVITINCQELTKNSFPLS